MISMSEVLNTRKPTRKFFINIVFFLLSIVVIIASLPAWKRNSWQELTGSLILVSSCYLVLYLFLSHFRSEILEVTRKTFFLIITILSFVVLTGFVSGLPDSNLIYVIPFAIIPIVIRTFYDARLALFILLVTIMLAGFIVPDPFEFVFLSFISGVVAIFSLSNINRRGKLFFSSVVVVLSYSIVYTGLVITDDGISLQTDLEIYKLFVINGLLILLCYPLIFLFERRFYFLSDTTLIELSDTNQPLLRRLAEEAPGSYHHSLQVAILAEEAARVTGSNILLARAGSLYHDIGKIVNSSYFIENQTNDINPHKDLDPLGSARIIIGHISEGVLLARKYKLPVQIIDFIRTHHGTTKAYYFYRKYLQGKITGIEKDNEFEYPGPKPFSREMAIVMMADAIEASSRTLESYTEFNISEMVERMLIIQEQDGQFSNAPLTFKDITDIKIAFKKKLANMYHARIVYPE